MCKSLEDSLKKLFKIELSKYDLPSLDDLYVLGGIKPAGATTLNTQRDKQMFHILQITNCVTPMVLI